MGRWFEGPTFRPDQFRCRKLITPWQQESTATNRPRTRTRPRTRSSHIQASTETLTHQKPIMYLLFKSQISQRSRTSSRTRTSTIFKIWRRQSAGNENKIPVIILITVYAFSRTAPRKRGPFGAVERKPQGKVSVWGHSRKYA